jgi:zinc protease
MQNSISLRAAPRPSSFASRVQKLSTRSGLEIWLLEDYTLPIISLSFAFEGCGSAQDPAAKPGVAAMLAGLLGKGCGLLDAEAFQQALDDDAIELSFGVGRDDFSGQIRTMSGARSRAFDLLAMALRAPRLDPDALLRQRDQIAASLKQGLNNPGQVASRGFRAACYGEHPYGRSLQLDALPAISRDDIAAMRERILARDTLKLGCVGAISAAVLRDEIERVFGPLPGAATLSQVQDVLIGGGGQSVAALDVAQSSICFGRQGIGREDPDYDAATLVNHCFGSGTTSRLFKEVREKRGLCYSIGTQNAAKAHAALFSGRTATSNERVVEAIAVIRDEMLRLAATGIAPDELERAKRYLTGSYALQFDTSGKIAAALCKLQLEGRDVTRLDTRNASIEAVSVADAARTAARLLGDGEWLVTIAGKPVGL